MNNKPDIAIKIDELNDSGILSTIILDTGFDLHTLDRKNAIYLVDSPTNAPIEEGTFLCKSYAKDNNTMVLEVSIVSSTSSSAWTKVLLDGVWGEWRAVTSNATSTTNGKQVELQKNTTHIQWKYTDEDEWKDLISIEELKGQRGEKGEQGLQGVNGRDGRDGRDLVLKKSNTHIQWKYSLEDEQYWRDLVELSELKGDRGESADTSQFYTKEEIDEKNGQLAEKTHTHTKEEISNFPTSLPANGGNADTVGGVNPNEFARKTGVQEGIIGGGSKILDTRNENRPPSWYFENKTSTYMRELKFCNTIQIPSGNGKFCTLETSTAWNDETGGKINQIAYLDGKLPMIRFSNGNEAWGKWQQLGVSNEKTKAYIAKETKFIQIQGQEQIVVNSQTLRCVYHFIPKYSGYVKLKGELKSNIGNMKYGVIYDINFKPTQPYNAPFAGIGFEHLPVGSNVIQGEYEVSGAIRASGGDFQEVSQVIYVKKGCPILLGLLTSAGAGYARNLKICYEEIEVN